MFARSLTVAARLRVFHVYEYFASRDRQGADDLNHENNNQRVKRQRFNQHKSKNQRTTDSRGSAGIARHPFGCARNRSALAKTAQAGSDSHTDTSENRLPFFRAVGLAGSA